MKTDRKLGIKPNNMNVGERFFFKFQLRAPIKTNIINEQIIVNSFTILGLRYCNKNLSNRIIKNGKTPK